MEWLLLTIHFGEYPIQCYFDPSQSSYAGFMKADYEFKGVTVTLQTVTLCPIEREDGVTHITS